MADIEFRERSYEGPLLHELQLGNAPTDSVKASIQSARLRSAVEHGLRNHEQRLDVAGAQTQSSKVCDEGKVLCLPTARPWSFHIEEEPGQRNAQGVGERRQRFEIWQAPRALNHAEKGNADAGFLGELFLSERERHAPLADPLTQLRSYRRRPFLQRRLCSAGPERRARYFPVLADARKRMSPSIPIIGLIPSAADASPGRRRTNVVDNLYVPTVAIVRQRRSASSLSFLK